MTDAPEYLVAMCEGERCVPMFVIVVTDHCQTDDPAVTQALLKVTLEGIATWLRKRGALGRLILLDGDTGETLASRRVWP